MRNGVLYNGQIWSVTRLAKAVGISRKAMTRRLNTYKTVEEALDRPDKKVFTEEDRRQFFYELAKEQFAEVVLTKGE